MHALAILLLSPTVAVMPFSDLSGGHDHVGQAIRETVTVDLSQVAGLTLVERAAIDRVLAEQKLQTSGELDPATTVRVGKLVGASLIALGAYQRQGERVRLTARFVDVATGVVRGSAKVDGAKEELFALQDRVTAELVRSAGLQAEAAKIAHRTRPKLRSFHAVELYGDALAAPDDDARRELLQAALAEEPHFEYATRDLDALEKRMAAYARSAERAQAEAGRAEIVALKQKLRSETDATVLGETWFKLFDAERAQKRYACLVVEAQAALAHPPPPAPSLPQSVPSSAQAWLVRANALLGHWDAALREGEKFMATYPRSHVNFDRVKHLMDEIIDEKRARKDGLTVLKSYDDDHMWMAGEKDDPCKMGSFLERQHLYPESEAKYVACLADPKSPLRAFHLHALASVSMTLGDFATARRTLDELRHYPREYHEARELAEALPDESPCP
jgi:TolB-like protein